jgi:hypothetical protein
MNTLTTLTTLLLAAATVQAGEVPSKMVELTLYVRDIEVERGDSATVLLEVKNGTNETWRIFRQTYSAIDKGQLHSTDFLNDVLSRKPPVFFNRDAGERPALRAIFYSRIPVGGKPDNVTRVRKSLDATVTLMPGETTYLKGEIFPEVLPLGECSLSAALTVDGKPISISQEVHLRVEMSKREKPARPSQPTSRPTK